MRKNAEAMSNFVDIVFGKIGTLINYGVWGNVTMERFKLWQKQFVTEEDRYMAASLAFNLLYYNRKDFLTLIGWSFTETIRAVAMADEKDTICYNDQCWKDKLNHAQNRLLVCPFAVDTPAASGNMVCRLLRNQGFVSESNICNIDELRARLETGKYDAVVFVDDIIGTGVQAREFFLDLQQIGSEYCSIRSILNRFEVKKFLAVAIAPKTSLQTVQRQTGLTIVAAELLTEKNTPMDKSFLFPEDYDLRKEFLRKIEMEHGIARNGYKGSDPWAVAFEHGVPDVSSPFYWQESPDWLSLIPFRGDDV